MENKILITGASSGFGFLTATALAEAGHKVVGTMRSAGGKNQESSEALRAAGIEIVEMDVTNDASVSAGVEKSIDLLGGLDVVINNAGVGVAGMQEHFTPEDMQKLFNVNVFGVQRVMRAVLPHLRGQGRGTVIYVSSLLGRMTLPFYGPYNASKWALEAMAENYRTELSSFGIESLIIEPGGFPTAFMENLITPSDSSQVESYGEFMNVPNTMAEGFGKALEENTMQRPERVAEAIKDLLDRSFGDRPFRTVVDYMGMGEPIKGYNDNLDQLTQGVYTAFGNEGMLELKK